MKYIGVDGCRQGWLAVSCENNHQPRALVFNSIADLWTEFRSASLILIDIPIGLPSVSPRQCDKLARRMLAKRGSSIFPTPSREAVYSPDYETACKINQQKLGKKISRQSWNICPKIREVDQLLQSDPLAGAAFREAHPELNFMTLSANRPMQFSKKTREGFDERLTLLQKYCEQSTTFVESLFDTYRRSQLSRDDILDAMVLALAAAVPKKNLVSLPGKPEYDRLGYAMEIVFSRQNFD